MFNLIQKKSIAPNARKLKEDKFGILARSRHTHGCYSARPTQISAGWWPRKAQAEKAAHAKQYPAMRLHPDICQKHKDFWQGNKFGKLGNYGRGQVLYTMREGGAWQKWPWNWVPSEGMLSTAALTCREFNKVAFRFVNPTYARTNNAVAAHSLLIDGRRWDCINGFTY